jgi:DNA primase
VAGRIRDEDITLVRERSPIADVIGEYVQLRNAGSGSLKGLCPFHDERSPSFNVTPARNLFYCLAGETRVLTAEGVRPIRELAGGIHRVLARDARWVDAPFSSFGVQPLMRLVLSRNGQTKEIHATPEHRWFVRSGVRSTREVVTKDLLPSHRLAWTFPECRIRNTTPSPFGIAHGITFGDGTLTGTGSMAQLDAVKDQQLLKWFPLSRSSENGRQVLVHHLPRFFKEVPPLTESVPYLYGWLAGYLAADGQVAEDGTVMLNCAGARTLEHVRAVCTRLGIGTYGVSSQLGFPGREPSLLCRVHLVNEDLTNDFFLLDEHRFRFGGSVKKFARREWVVRSVEPTDRVEEVFCATVEQGHAFVLEDNILTGNCFGCGQGGDVIRFVEKIDHLSFNEAVERLAARAGVQLRYEQGGSAPVRQQGQRARLVEAHRLAAEFYADLLAGSAEARPARDFLTGRGFDPASAEVARYGCGYAPAGWEALSKHLSGKGFSAQELITAGLSRQSQRGGLIDRFHRRLLWPIREVTGDVVGFGARRLYEDDQIEAKYLNTPETPLYKKSQVLYGLDLAKREIGRQLRAVVVEGYTDVMACHLAGVPTAVATCGTAFGPEHIGMLRRLLMDSDTFRGEVIFTFDGDAAGQRAALRAFEQDQRFMTQLFVAVEPGGLDPCELRQRKGDAAVRDLVARRRPLVEFALRTAVDRYDLDTAEGKIGALGEAVPVVARIKDEALRDEYARRLAGMVGPDDPDEVVRRVRRITGAAGPPQTRRAPAPRRDDPALQVERESLKLAVQAPALAGPMFDAVEEAAFTDPTYRAVRAAVAAAGGTSAGRAGPEWVDRVADQCPDLVARSLVTELAVESLRTTGEPDARYVAGTVSRLQELKVSRDIAQLKSRLQRLNPVEQAEEYTARFGQLVGLEQLRRGLREQALGGA